MNFEFPFGKPNQISYGILTTVTLSSSEFKPIRAFPCPVTD